MIVQIETFDLESAAHFLKMHPDTLQRKAAAGEIPGAKVGKNWVFVNIHLADFIREQYCARQPEREGACGKEDEWHFKEQKVDGSMLTLQPRVDAEYESLLAPKTKPRRKSITTN